MSAIRAFYVFYKSRLCRSIIHDMAEMTTEMSSAMRNPKRLSSMPLMRFIQKNEDISVGNIMIIDTDVSVRITVFMLLLMIDE